MAKGGQSSKPVSAIMATFFAGAIGLGAGVLFALGGLYWWEIPVFVFLAWIGMYWHLRGHRVLSSLVLTLGIVVLMLPMLWLTP